MKYLLITILILVGIGIGVITDAALFNWSQGQPTIIDDSANTTYYCWTSGQPTVCYQYYAGTPTPTPPPPSVAKPEIWWE